MGNAFPITIKRDKGHMAFSSRCSHQAIPISGWLCVMVKAAGVVVIGEFLLLQDPKCATYPITRSFSPSRPRS
jgi:hypothetical protein